MDDVGAAQVLAAAEKGRIYSETGYPPIADAGRFYSLAPTASEYVKCNSLSFP